MTDLEMGRYNHGDSDDDQGLNRSPFEPADRSQGQQHQQRQQQNNNGNHSNIRGSNSNNHQTSNKDKGAFN